MIEVKNLSLRLDHRPILQDINFSLEDGHNLIILGRSGCGKTVLIKTLMGLFRPERGTVLVDGLNVHGREYYQRPQSQNLFSMVFQNAALLDSFTVFQNVALPLYERGLDYQDTLEKVRQCLAVVGLEDTMKKYPANLSGGMRKRVGIARALVYSPRYIIFDEPVSGLDPITSGEVLYYIKYIITSHQATTITITHDIANLTDIGDRVLFLEDGQDRFYGTVKQLYAQADPLLRQFLASASCAGDQASSGTSASVAIPSDNSDD